MRSARAFVSRTLRAVKMVVRDGRIPKPLRWGGAFGALPIPGPFDEAVLLFVGAILWLFYRGQLTEAWQRADRPRDIYATQQLLGHADVSTTANIYVQGSAADLEAKLRNVWGE